MDWNKFKAKKDDDILRSMIDYMNGDEDDDEDFNCGYTQQDIDQCASILDSYIDELIVAKKDEKTIMKAVKGVITKLNKLNKKCDHSIIETDQREYLCDYIEEAAIAAGLPKPPYDITEKWREW